PSFISVAGLVKTPNLNVRQQRYAPQYLYPCTRQGSVAGATTMSFIWLSALIKIHITFWAGLIYAGFGERSGSGPFMNCPGSISGSGPVGQWVSSGVGSCGGETGRVAYFVAILRGIEGLRQNPANADHGLPPGLTVRYQSKWGCKSDRSLPPDPRAL